MSEWTPQRFATIRQMRKDGMMVRDIAKALGTSSGTMHRMCNANGMPIVDMPCGKPKRSPANWSPERLDVLYACAALRSGPSDCVRRVQAVPGPDVSIAAVHERYRAACQEVAPVTPVEDRPVIHFWKPPPAAPKVVQIIRKSPRAVEPDPVRKRVPWEGEGGFSMMARLAS